MAKKRIWNFTFILGIFCSLSAFSNNLYTDSIRAENTYNSGINFFRNSNYQAAIDSFLISAQIREKIYTQKSYEFGVVQNALGITYKNLGNLDKSIEYFLNAEEAYLFNLNENELALARLYNNIGNTYKSKLNFITALEYSQRAVTIFLKDQNSDIQNIADVYYTIADIYFRLKNYQEALKIIDKYSENSYADTKLLYLSLTAAIYQELNQYDKTLFSYKMAIDYAENYYSSNDPNIVFEYLNFADFLIKSNNLTEAKNELNKAKNILNKNNISEGLALSFFNKTQGFLNENIIVETKNIEDFRQQKSLNLLEAVNYYKKGLEALGTDPERLLNVSATIENTASLTQSLELLKLIADTYTQISDIYANTTHIKRKESIEQALEYYEFTANLIQQARKEIYSDESKIQLNELEEETFAKIVQTAYNALTIEPNPQILEFAFTNAERMKASSVFDKLSAQLASENSLVPDSLTELERTLNFQITNQNENLYNLRNAETPDNEEINMADSTLFQLKKERDELIQFLETNYSDYFELKYADATITTKQVQQKLKSNEVAIEYVLNETDSVPELYAFFISKEKISFHKIDIDSSFIKNVEETFRFMSNPGYLFTRSDNTKEFSIAAFNLYTKLIEPFSNQIQNKKITIIPDGKLNYLPFDALLTEMPDTTETIKFNLLPYLIKRNSINYAYSANLLYKFNNPQRKAKNRLLAFAPKYNSDTVVFENEKLILTQLPGVQREVDLIASEIKVNLFRNENATEENFRKYSHNYDILHLAMHAFINDSLPAFSRFAFAQNNDNEPQKDGWLNTADIYNLDINARLTVLSACNTGSGNLRKGEGVMSLARGFLYAGCPTIVMTLWEVEDNAGTKIMSSFYQNLKKGRSTDEALRLAKLNYLENANPRMAHPHYWLGYVSIGNSIPLFRSYDYYFFGLLILAFAGIITDQFIRLKKARKKRMN
ncbi:CHAT domain-containing protein [Mariniphaga sp.]|uniref:CHAT domain-containing protein n=1 Tax=Mariniphaga sp. TaxID=1954475 RepID=UPI0035614477